MLKVVTAAQHEIRMREASEVTQQIPQTSLLPGRRNRVAEAHMMLDNVHGLIPPESLCSLHDDAEAQVERFLNWLTLELQWGEAGTEAHVSAPTPCCRR